MAKPTRNEYLQTRLEEAKKINPNVNISIPTGSISKAKLTELDAALNKVIYPSGQYGVTGTAYKAPDPNAERDAAAAAEKAADKAVQRQNWKEVLKTTLESWGLPTLVSVAQGYIDNNYNADTAILKLQETPEYKQRFSGNVKRAAKGLPVLEPGTYLDLENQYRATMRAAGLPSGFYDDPADYSDFITNDVSPAELQQRVNIASLSLDNADPYYVQSLQNLYGLSKGDMVAYTLDPQRAMPFINKQVQAAQFGAAAARQGLTVDVSAAEQFAGLGVTQQQAEAGFQQIGQMMPTAEKLSSIYKQASPYGQEQAMAETFGGAGGAEAALRRKRLSDIEQAKFSGSSGTGKSSFAQQQLGQI